MGCGNSSSVSVSATATVTTDKDRARVLLYRTPQSIARLLNEFVLDVPFLISTHLLAHKASETLAFDELRAAVNISVMQHYTGKGILHLESIEVVTRLGVHYHFAVNGQRATTELLIFCPVGIRSVNFKRAAGTHSNQTLNSFTSHVYFCSP